MVCRKRTESKSAYFNGIKPQIEERIKEKLEQFWNEGIGGSDFFISAIGPAMEVFGKYESVEKLSGEKVSAKELLELVRKTVSEYALSIILTPKSESRTWETLMRKQGFISSEGGRITLKRFTLMRQESLHRQ